MLKRIRTRTIYRLRTGTATSRSAEQIAAREISDSDPEAIENAALLLKAVVAERQEQPLLGPSVMVDVVRAPRGRQRWSVVDSGSPSLPKGLRSTALDELADAWGVSRRNGLTRTWFEIQVAV